MSLSSITSVQARLSDSGMEASDHIEGTLLNGYFEKIAVKCVKNVNVFLIVEVHLTIMQVYALAVKQI